MRAPPATSLRKLLAIALVPLFLCFLMPRASAEEHADLGDYHVVRWTTADGLPSNTVRALAQTPDGLLWIGTWAGLARFDGVSLETFDLTNTPELGDIGINCLCVDHDGTLWIGTFSGFVSRYRDGRFERALPRLKPGLCELCVDRAGTLWAGGRGLARLEGGAWREVLDVGVWDIQPGPSGSIWVATSAGVREVRDDAIVPPAGDTSQMGIARGLSSLPGGGVLAHGTSCLMRFPEGRVVGQGHEPELQGWRLWGSAWLREGSCMWASEAGIYRVSPEALAQDSFALSPSMRVVPRSYTGSVRAVVEDREGSIALGSESEGLLLLSPRLVQRIDGKIESVVAMADGTAWMTRAGIPVHRTEVGREERMPGGFERAHVSAARGGGIWVAHPNGYARFRDGRIESFGLPQGLSFPRRSLFEDTGGALWWHDSRLSRIEGEEVTQRLRGGILGEARGGALLIQLAGQGIGRLRDGRFEAAHELEGLGGCEDSAGRIWAGTKGRGLLCIEANRTTFLTTAHGLPSNVIGAIVEDDRRRLCINSSAGVFIAEIEALMDVVEGREAVLLCQPVSRTEMGHLPSSLSANGVLYASTIHGYERIDTRALRPLPPPPASHIRHVWLAGRQHVGQDRITVSPESRAVQIAYTAPSLRTGRFLQFRYRLDGVDSDWVAGREMRTAIYPDLPPRKLTFRVMARHVGGDWGQPASVTIDVEALFYERIWFRALSGVLLMGGILGLFWYRRRARRSKSRALIAEMEWHKSEATARALAGRLLTAQENERKRISRELHDDISQRLVLLILGLETQPDATEEHVEALRALSSDIHRISHDLHPASLEKIGLATALRAIVRNIDSHTGIEVSFEPSGDVGALNEAKALALYRVAQEALANVVRHSQASRVHVRLDFTPGEVCLAINDDGVGFDVSQADGTGIGLLGMMERVQTVGAVLKIDSAPGRGTCVEVRLPRRRGL